MVTLDVTSCVPTFDIRIQRDHSKPRPLWNQIICCCCIMCESASVENSAIRWFADIADDGYQDHEELRPWIQAETTRRERLYEESCRREEARYQADLVRYDAQLAAYEAAKSQHKRDVQAVRDYNARRPSGTPIKVTPSFTMPTPQKPHLSLPLRPRTPTVRDFRKSKGNDFEHEEARARYWALRDNTGLSQINLKLLLSSKVGASKINLKYENKIIEIKEFQYEAQGAKVLLVVNPRDYIRLLAMDA